jgi:cyclophilin family peptidyl-prolyl cis-trans isomerase
LAKAAKRARKKQHRDAIAAQRAAALRRRRAIRTGVIVVAVGGIVALALISGRDEPGASNGGGRGNQSGPAAACGADAPEASEPRQYERPEEVTEQSVDYGALVSTSCGDFTVDLLEDQAPKTVNNFVFLAREGFYDGLTFHRVERNAVIQGGDPQGDGTGGPGYSIPDELPDSPDDYTYGVVGMANSGPDTGGSQFFVVVKPQGSAGYRPDYSIFGQVDPNDETSTETLDRISTRETRGGNDPSVATQPVVPIYLESVEITEN